MRGNAFVKREEKSILGGGLSRCKGPARRSLLAEAEKGGEAGGGARVQAACYEHQPPGHCG